MGLISGMVMGVVVGVALMAGWSRVMRRRSRKRIAKAADIKVLGSLGRDDLKKLCGDNFPEWVSFPQFEQVKWLNKHLSKLWPFVAQVEGDLVAITVDPVVYWTRMKGPNIACNPVIGGDAVVREVSETNGNHSLKKGQTDASCRFENSSNGLPVLDRMHYHHKNSGFNQAVKCENGHATVPESYEKDLNEGKTEAARALQRICSMIYSHPSRRPTGKVLSIVKKSPRRNAVVGFLAPFSEFPDGDQQSVQGSKRMNHRASSFFTGLIHLLPTDPKFPLMIVSVSTLPDGVRQSLKEGDTAIEKELVAARIDEWNEESLYPRAHVVQFLGKGGQVKTHMNAILFENAIL